MRKTSLSAVALVHPRLALLFLLMFFAFLLLLMPAFGKTYKYTYPAPCADVWGAVKNTLTDEQNYAQVKIADEQMTADYQPKHSVHFDVSGVLLQRMNHVTLISRDKACEMHVVSNYSGWGHEDQGDFKKRVDEALIKQKSATAAQPVVPQK